MASETRVSSVDVCKMVYRVSVLAGRLYTDYDEMLVTLHRIHWTYCILNFNKIRQAWNTSNGNITGGKITTHEMLLRHSLAELILIV